MMDSFFVVLSSFLLSITTGQQLASDWHYIGSFEADKPSFVQLMHLQPSATDNPLELDLVVSHFTEIGVNGIDAFPDIGLYLRNISNSKTPPMATLVDHTLTWPNWVYIAEPGVFPAETTLIIHDGFLTPFHTKGGVYALLLNDSTPSGLIRLSAADSTHCYVHNSTMIDMNGDGRLDLLYAETCTKQLNPKSQHGSLVWLEQPASNPETPESWTKHTLVDGPDFFTHVFAVNASTIIVFAAQFWDPKLAYYYVQIGADVRVIGEAVVINDTIGPLEGLAIVDLFKDGRQQILTNSHSKDAQNNAYANGVFLFEFPDGFPYGTNEFIGHEIAHGFNTTNKMGVGAPGICMPFDLNSELDSKAPFKIGVSGDGNFQEWQLTVTDQDTFTFSREIIQYVGGTTGIMAFGDVTGDGYTEMFIPFYEDGLIYVYTANPDHELVQK